jgi:hypothetical protein
LFAEVVYEITLHPRPASHTHSGNVETDHPHEVGRYRTLLNYQTTSPKGRSLLL